MKTSHLSTIACSVMSAAHLAVLLLWLDTFEFWLMCALFTGAVMFALLAWANVEQ